MIHQGLLTGVTPKKRGGHYIKAVVKGVVKVMSKMGICTIDGYRGAQIFEALGLESGAGRPLLHRHGLARRRRRHGCDRRGDAAAPTGPFPRPRRATRTLATGGQYQWRSDGEHHNFNPLTVHKLQMACRTGNYGAYQEYSTLIDIAGPSPVTLRNLLDFVAPQPVPIDEVESVESICKRFKTGAMSYGSISPEAHEALAIAMNRIGGKSNSGEGGEDPARYIPNAERRSAIQRHQAGRVRPLRRHQLLSEQRPGDPDQDRPGREAGRRRPVAGPQGLPLDRPRAAFDARRGADLAPAAPRHLLHRRPGRADLRPEERQPARRISVKLVSEVGVGTIAAGVAKGHADVILVSGFDGGTGASPQTGIKHAGLPWELAVAETHQTLLVNNLRSRVRLETDGQLKTGRDVVIAALLGAEEFGFATAPLVALGCTMMRVCHLDTCPVGVATQNPELRKNFRGDPAYVVNFMCFVAQEVREMMARLGFRTFNEMVGRTDRLSRSPAVHPQGNLSSGRPAGLDLSVLLAAGRARLGGALPPDSRRTTASSRRWTPRR